MTPRIVRTIKNLIKTEYKFIFILFAIYEPIFKTFLKGKNVSKFIVDSVTFAISMRIIKSNRIFPFEHLVLMLMLVHYNPIKLCVVVVVVFHAKLN